MIAAVSGTASAPATIDGATLRVFPIPAGASPSSPAWRASGTNGTYLPRDGIGQAREPGGVAAGAPRSTSPCWSRRLPGLDTIPAPSRSDPLRSRALVRVPRARPTRGDARPMPAPLAPSPDQPARCGNLQSWSISLAARRTSSGQVDARGASCLRATLGLATDCGAQHKSRAHASLHPLIARVWCNPLLCSSYHG
jgi:hypothetical protein